jgi:two-component system CheB/CheR fusion protein
MVIRTFTPAITTIFNLIASDRGRPLTDIANDLDGVDLRQEIDAVLRSRQGSERRVVRRGRHTHYLMRILPDHTATADGGVLISFIDITPMVEFEQHLREFNDGADTMLQMVLQIADATLAQAPTESAETEAGMSRLRCLGGIYTLLSRVEWNAIALRDLVTDEVGGLGITAAARVNMNGPAISLKPKAAIVLGLALHELVVNARRYGALSGTRGSVGLGWSIETNGAEPRLLIEWRERGGPAVAKPEHNGFGRRIIERELAAELSGETAMVFTPQGVEARIAVPVDGHVVAS